jgi:hypothetical protein
MRHNRAGVIGVGIAILAVAGFVIATRGPDLEAAASPDPESASSAVPEIPERASIEAHLVGDSGPIEYPTRSVEIGQKMAMGQWKDDPVTFEDGDGRLTYAARRDLALSITAQHARFLGLPYRESDLLAPVVDAHGKLVGYTASGLGRYLSPQEVSVPGFDLCRLQVAVQRDILVHAREDAASGKLGPNAPVPTASAEEQLGCPVE